MSTTEPGARTEGRCPSVDAPIRLTRNHDGDVLVICGDQRQLLHRCEGFDAVLPLLGLMVAGRLGQLRPTTGGTGR